MDRPGVGPGIRMWPLAEALPWPDNVWMSVSVGDAHALSRVDDLRQVPAAIRFLSCEPLLTPLRSIDLAGIDWVIAGGGSGPHHRPVDATTWLTSSLV